MKRWLLRLLRHRCPCYRVRLLMLMPDGRWGTMVDADAGLIALATAYGVDNSQAFKGTFKLTVTEGE